MVRVSISYSESAEEASHHVHEIMVKHTLSTTPCHAITSETLPETVSEVDIADEEVFLLGSPLYRASGLVVKLVKRYEGQAELNDWIEEDENSLIIGRVREDNLHLMLVVNASS